MVQCKFIRYPGGKQRLLDCIVPYIPTNDEISGTYIEPFIGGGSIFFHTNPSKSVISDKNLELINLYKGIRDFPDKVWNYYTDFPSTKNGYYRIRNQNLHNKSLPYRAARTLFLNRTCFKGMWRHNSMGKFNVGYGGQDRRWAITEEDIHLISDRLENVDIKHGDFQRIINKSTSGDFIFLDPPYKPKERELKEAHYSYGIFPFDDYGRLSKCLHNATDRGVKWALTISSHPDILNLFKDYEVIAFTKGTSNRPGIIINNPGEVLINNYEVN